MKRVGTVLTVARFVGNSVSFPYSWTDRSTRMPDDRASETRVDRRQSEHCPARGAVAAGRFTVAAWGAFVLGNLLAVVFLLGEATVLPQLAAAGESARFAVWRAFIETGVIASLFPVTVGLVLVAWDQARHPSPRTPAWAAWGGLLTFGAGLVWIVGFGFLGVEPLAPLFLVQLLGFFWLGWLGVTLARSDGSEPGPDASGAAGAE